MPLLYLIIVLLVGVNCQKNDEERLQKVEADIQEMTVQLRFLTSGLVDVMETMKSLKDELNMSNRNTDTICAGKALNDTDLEERVTVLEEQVMDLGEELDNVEDQVLVIKADQILQDERILELEEDTDSLEVDIQELDAAVDNLQAYDNEVNLTLAEIDSQLGDLSTSLDGALESIDGLQSSVSALEQTDAELSEEIENLSIEIEDLDVAFADLRLGLSKLELNGTIAFHAFLGSYTTIPEGSVVIFPNINVNIGQGYDGTTGQFVVPSGGGGLYYMYAYFRYDYGKWAQFTIRNNEITLCAAYEDENSSIDDSGSSCGAVIILQEGDTLDVLYATGWDDFPVVSSTFPEVGFTGFRIAPQ